jgi:hypothetical protein
VLEVSVLSLAIGWTAVSVLAGPMVGSFLHRRGAELLSGWDPRDTLDDAAITPFEAFAGPRSRHTT